VTAGITGTTRVYLHLAHPSAHARTPQVMNAEFAWRGVDAVAVSADVAPGDLGGFARGRRGWVCTCGYVVFFASLRHHASRAAAIAEGIYPLYVEDSAYAEDSVPPGVPNPP
jgi:shikimate 5-dehydrogenase